MSAEEVTPGEVAPADEKVEKRHVMEAICTLGLTRVEWAAAFAQRAFILGGGRETVIILEQSTSGARHKAVELAREKDADILFFWDDDIIPLNRNHQAGMIAAMAYNPHIDVIGGVYPLRRDVPEPIVSAAPGAPAYWGWQDGKIHKVYMVGTAFMAIRLESFTDIPLPWFDDSELTSDDYTFAALCEQHGKSIYVDGRAVCDQIDLSGLRYNIAKGVSDITVSKIADYQFKQLHLKGSRTIGRAKAKKATLSVNGT
jgi:hypothetical protein